MTQNVTRLIDRLIELERKLETFDVNLEEEFRLLEVSWARLDLVWGGDAAEEFKGEWEEVRALILQYVSLSNRYESFLRERIEWLRLTDRGGTL